MYDKGKNSGTFLFYVAGFGIILFLALLIYSTTHPEIDFYEEPEVEVVEPEPEPEPEKMPDYGEILEREIIEAEEGEQEILGEISFDEKFGECDSPGKPYPF